MNERIRFDRTKFDSKGRNGYVGTTGINGKLLLAIDPASCACHNGPRSFAPIRTC